MSMPPRVFAIAMGGAKAAHDRHAAAPIRRGFPRVVLTDYQSGLAMVRKFNLKALLACCVFGVLLLPAVASAQAAPGTCLYLPGNKTVTVPTVTFPADAPIGTTVSVTGSSSHTGDVGAYCNELNSETVFLVAYYMVGQQTLVPGYTDVYTTNYPGLGVRIPITIGLSGWQYVNTGQIDSPMANEALAANSAGDYYLVPFNGAGFNGTGQPFQFVKISDALVTGNVPPTNLLATYYRWFYWREESPVPGPTNTVIPQGSNAFFGFYVLNGFQVIEPTPTCTLATSSATFNMGNVPETQFTGVGTEQPWVPDQSLISGGCTAATTVTMTFAGTAAAAPYANAFANSGTAQGIGLELWQADGAQAIPNGGAITFAAQGAGGAYTFAARYIQIAPTIISGSVSATVTVTLNYQ